MDGWMVMGVLPVILCLWENILYVLKNESKHSEHIICFQRLFQGAGLVTYRHTSIFNSLIVWKP